MIRRDMPEVLAIEHASFEYPWCEEEFLRVLRQRNCIGMVAEQGERIVGFMVYELHRNKIQTRFTSLTSRPTPIFAAGESGAR
jgi:ribosomal-protein-alanine N-acetyltransferase